MWSLHCPVEHECLQRHWLLLVVFCTWLAPASQGWAQADIAGSSDPLGVPRYLHSWIVDYDYDDELLVREFAIGRVDKTRRDIRIEKEIRVPATIERATYQMPAGTPLAELITHYVAFFKAGELFSCAGRDCGRSNDWANHIFKKAILYGPDKNQFYFAGTYGDHLISFYVIERGNKRVYAHLEVLKPETRVAIDSNRVLLEHLAGDGYSVIDGLVPAADGSLPESAQDILAALAQKLSIFSGQTIYVICHLYSSASTSRLLDSAQHCSEQAVTALTGVDGPTLVPFAAGPLLPRATGAKSRIELVLPHRLDHD
jgi:hypothetical protein